MKILKVLGLITLVVLLNSSGCKKQETSQVAPQSDFCYEGVAGDCPSIIVVQVTNANIGENWNFGGETYNNCLTLNNSHIIKTNDSSIKKIYFTLDLDKDPLTCIQIKPCVTLPPLETPTPNFCAKTISSEPCNNENN